MHFARKILLLLSLCALAAVAADSPAPVGTWLFVYYTKAPSAIGEMPPPPLFDGIEVRADGTAVLRIQTKLATPTVTYSIEKDVIRFALPLPPTENTMPFFARFKVDEETGTLSLQGKDSEAVFLRREGLLPLRQVAGTWQNDAEKFTETLDLGEDGLFRLRKSLLIGFYRLWKNKQGRLVLTVIAARPGTSWHTFLWEVEPSPQNLVLTPIGPKGAIPQHKSVWHPAPLATPQKP